VGKEMPAPQQGKDLPLVTGDKAGIRSFIPIGTAVFHTVLFRIALHLPVAKHRQARHGGHHDADAKVLVIPAKLVDGRTLVGIVHKVHVPLEDARVELECVLDYQAILGVLFIAQHVHEGRVVHPVHAERTHEIAFHQPECLGEKQRVRRFLRRTVDDFPPELGRHAGVELLTGQPMLGARGDSAAAPRLRVPQPLDVGSHQRHRRVKADDGELPRNFQDGLDDRFAHARIEIIQLSGVVPGHAGAVVAVINVFCLSVPVIVALEHNCRVTAGVVVVFQVYADRGVLREVRPVEGVPGEGAVVLRNKPVRMFKNPV